MNSLLTPDMKVEGIRYVLATGSIESLNKKTGDRTKKKDKQSATDESTTGS
jgi:hypothetical protein